MSEVASLAPPRVPVTIVTGFLGAGKTSVLNHVLTSSHGRRIAVVVNDFGRINIDAELLQKSDGDVVALANGCICCSLSESLIAGVARLVRQDSPPEQIIVETSGVSDPLDVARAFTDPELQRFAPLDGIVTVVDCELAPTLEGDMLRLASRQVIAADIVLLNKCDLVDEAERMRASRWVNALSPHVRPLQVEHGRVPIDLVLGMGGATQSGSAVDSEPPGHHQHEATFDTFTYESMVPLHVQRLHDCLSQLPKTIFRAKGIVNLLEKPGYPVVLQSTGKRATLTVGQPWAGREPRTQIVFIGTRGGVDGDWIEGQLIEPHFGSTGRSKARASTRDKREEP
ncbi:CobW family GTP-binding protein [Salipiger mangrovisoli]|uniref:GTP-binding protein n=1 Tax=Salipiger mangrovisoli TaxID=2865933 RepID=A0ABR9WYD1_9RHOB|nr:GTP-binding protein [Salipiger mangrovisoli]MBE9636299.1 GTP-binding protein [Salipiger mangrovisoli]